ncbi:alkylated DNA repair protein AlkB [Phlyctema vagabunda]|uniref:Alkylated DNA repair protein AlkB n=1 Tax=Phlyctema vagabunda TaxID=108571 RepID=A0ABR4P798_9HELO
MLVSRVVARSAENPQVARFLSSKNLWNKTHTPQRVRARAHVMDQMNGDKGHHGHDTHAMPPQAICNAYKKYQKMDDKDVENDLEVLDFNRGLSDEQREKLVEVGIVKSEIIAEAQAAFKEVGDEEVAETADPVPSCIVYEHKDFPGLKLLPSLLPPECQVLLLSKLMHRDLSNAEHKTNISQDYHIPFPPQGKSLFSLPPASQKHIFNPKVAGSRHKPLQATQVLHKKLRWLTLGAQYDWPTRSYPSRGETQTHFPEDISKLVNALFPTFRPESGVVLLYSTKDYMPVHRDVSEECQKDLASFTLGCDGLFIIARDFDGLTEEEKQNEDRDMKTVVIRVRSGDVVQMGGETRWAWHAMPKIIGSTAPDAMSEWPVGQNTPKEYEKWRGYMRTKRLNISCRQVWD